MWQATTLKLLIIDQLANVQYSAKQRNNNIKEDKTKTKKQTNTKEKLSVTCMVAALCLDIHMSLKMLKLSEVHSVDFQQDSECKASGCSSCSCGHQPENQMSCTAVTTDCGVT